MSRTSGTEQRRRFTPDEKATILRRHLVDKVAVSDLCDEYHLQPTIFYLWQRQALERLSEVLQDGRRARAQRDAVVDFVRAFSVRTELTVRAVRAGVALAPAQCYRWAERYGQVNTHNGRVPRDHWLTPAEQAAILAYHEQHAPEGYRRLAFMMLDADVVAVSPATVYRVLKAHGRLDRWNGKRSKKGTGFVQPLQAHEHWHIDISYLNIAGTLYYLCTILDGATRFIIHWELRERMTEADVETVLQRAREAYPGAMPRISPTTGRSVSRRTARPSFARPA